MAISSHRVRAHEARRITHPVFSHIEKHWLTIAAKELPAGISTKANARDPVGLNRSVYKDVRESLDGTQSVVGTFDLMNKGITILATSVRLLDKEKGIYEITVDDEEGGIVDGAHTAKIIWEANADGTTPPEQHVEVFIRTGIEGGLVTDIARGLNTGIQVADRSIYNIAGVFDWLKDLIDDKPYASLISWRESDAKEYDVRDLVGVLELFNVIDFPMEAGKHPIAAYEKWSTPLKKFADDYEANKNDLQKSVYYRLKELLPGALALYDHIRRDFREVHNQGGGIAGRMNIVEERGKKGPFTFPFAQLPAADYRLTKGAAFPILGAFRNYVELNPTTGFAQWRGGFDKVLQAWKDAAPELVEETDNARKEVGRNPDQLGKSRKHWDNLHMKMQLRLLRARLSERDQEGRTRRR
jgi:hypothetical protein